MSLGVKSTSESVPFYPNIAKTSSTQNFKGPSLLQINQEFLFSDIPSFIPSKNSVKGSQWFDNSKPFVPAGDNVR